jgi:hypothetical protein
MLASVSDSHLSVVVNSCEILVPPRNGIADGLGSIYLLLLCPG